MRVPAVDITALRQGDDPDGRATNDVAAAIDEACRRTGFFYVVGHGVDPELPRRVEKAAREFFAQPEEAKAGIAMEHGGRAWRGWFPVGAELTDGRPDRKEGIYFGAELGSGHPAVDAGLALHGPNLFPERPAELRSLVLGYLEEMTTLGRLLLEGMALALGQERQWFTETITADPTVLFRIFHYPPEPADDVDPGWGVGEHTDYGLLTILHQDHTGGLQVRTPDGWVDAPPVPGAFVCNLGNMLEPISGGRYRSTPHRVRNTSGESRISMPFFFDPSWDAELAGVTGTYGQELVRRVTRVFPRLAERVALRVPPR